MAAIKAYTNIEQSKKLAEILPPESADMFYVAGKGEPIFIGNKMVAYGNDDYDALGDPDVLCWSLAALLNILPNYQMQTQDDGTGILCSCNGKFNIVTADNPVDVCYELIIKLHGLNLLRL
jgi:hypothetical protein